MKEKENELFFTKIQHMKETIVKSYQNKNDEIWIQAFEEYNKHNNKLSMNCGGCYSKVLRYHVQINQL